MLPETKIDLHTGQINLDSSVSILKPGIIDGSQRLNSPVISNYDLKVEKKVTMRALDSISDEKSKTKTPGKALDLKL